MDDVLSVVIHGRRSPPTVYSKSGLLYRTEPPVIHGSPPPKKLTSVLQRRWLDFSSLQIRLTLGVILGCLPVFGLTVGWTIWKTEQMLVAQQQQTLSTFTQRLSDLTAAGDPSNPDARFTQPFQAMINQLSTSNVWMWIRDRDQRILARSPELWTTPIARELLAVDQTGAQAQTLHLPGGRVIMVYADPLTWQGTQVGQLYVARDVTQDYAMLGRLIQSLQLISVGAIALLGGFVTWFIRRSLRPLNHLKQVTSEHPVTRENLYLSRIESDAVPTEVRELAQIYNQLRDRLSESSLKQQQFTTSISHELRTPLSLVYGYLQSTLKRSPNLTESQQEALSIAVVETENIIQLLHALLENARLEDHLARLHLQPVLVNGLVEEMICTVQQLEHRVIHLDAAEHIVAIADPDALGRVLTHLLSNAVRYSAPDQPIVLRLIQQPDWVQIQVNDCGCGIEPSQQSLIFEPLYRVDLSRSRSTGGVGLGLPIARSLVERMGGHITVQSEPGRGSTFTVTLRRVTP